MPLTTPQLHQWNSYICFAVGASANLGLLWLIRYRTSSDLRFYSLILAQAAVLDLLNLGINLLFHPVNLSHGNDSITAGVGLALLDPTQSIANRWWNFSLSQVWSLSTTIIILSVPQQFYYRYTVVCKGRQPSLSTYFLLTLIPVAGALLFCASSVYAKSNLSDANMDQARRIFTPDEAPTIITYNGIADAPALRFQNTVPLVLDLVAYGFVAYFGARTWLHVRSQLQAIAPTPKTSALNRQLTAVLLFQALTPIVFGVGLSYVVQFFNIAALSQEFAALSAFTACNNWIPVANGFFALAVIRPYRRVVLSYVCYLLALGTRPLHFKTSTGTQGRATSNVAPAHKEIVVV